MSRRRICMKWIGATALSSLTDTRVPNFWRRAGRLMMAAILFISLMPGITWACACGCSVFDVGTPSLIPKVLAAPSGSNTIL